FSPPLLHFDNLTTKKTTDRTQFPKTSPLSLTPEIPIPRYGEIEIAQYSPLK
ncbi:hypothetical protein AVEN_113213-1, partial [Araneus ventricosus]